MKDFLIPWHDKQGRKWRKSKINLKCLYRSIIIGLARECLGFQNDLVMFTLSDQGANYAVYTAFFQTKMYTRQRRTWHRTDGRTDGLIIR